MPALRSLALQWLAPLRHPHPSLLNFGAALWLLLVLNEPFWRALRDAAGASNLLLRLTLPLFVLGLVWLALELLSWGRAARPVLSALLLASAGAAYFMQAYGIVFDRSMVTNLLETHPAEALELLSWRLVAWVLLLGGLPVLLLWRTRPRPLPWGRLLLAKAMVLAALAAGLVLIVAPNFAGYAALLRNHRELRLQLVPTNWLAALHGQVRLHLRRPQPLQVVGPDARQAARPAGAKPRLLLLVVGETARAANFSLNGYARPTNPRLATQADLLSLKQASSCGTATATSLPCMFLDVGRAGFEDGLAQRRESLLDVLQRAGVAVLWRDNNSGCKGVCDRVPSEDLSALQVPELCSKEECWDEVLLHGLQNRIDALRGDAVIVLHMKGSHGPAYHLRVPPGYAHFQPVCQSNQLDRCRREHIVNAYDNTLRYTDHVLAEAIELLKRQAERFDPALIYVSDHGESLGENGLYLHGLPYAMAPQEQTHIPWLLWLPDQTRRAMGLEVACLRKNESAAIAHDDLHPMVMQLMGVVAASMRNGRSWLPGCGAVL